MKTDEFKDRLKTAMQGSSNVAFANKCGLSEGTIRRYLRGEAFPPLDTLEVISGVSGYSLAWLATGDDSDQAQELRAAGVTHAELRELDRKRVLAESQEAWQTMSPEERTSSIIMVPGNHDPEVLEIVHILENDLPEAKEFVLKVLRGQKQIKEGLEGLGMKLKEEN